MRTPLALLLAALLAFPAYADQNDPRLARLFNQLASVRTAPEATAVEEQINKIWLESGSDTVDVLMARAQVAFEAQDLATAKKLLDAVTEMTPDFAEVWYRRAELLLTMDSQQEAAADLSKAIELEPRHFRAYAIAGRLADTNGDRSAALDAYRRAVKLNPMLEAIARRAGQLANETISRPPT